ncbi:MAG: serine/threonine protein kinase [Acidobacteria bacterium]|nr:serine/threonine protein kinase [Acidobacteriota bacterium]MCK6686054.1 serine/threonine protein kinase [Thermoanaerobaculia bacterium]
MIVDRHLIPGFTLLGRLATGGMASVFKAQRDSDGFVLALKILGLQDLDEEFHPTERFRREAALLERVSHSALPRFFGYGVTDDGFGWIALEYVEGRPLSAFCRRPVAALLPLFIQVAEGLQAIAAEGIIHRDVSPDNILVEERNGRYHARLIDFGIAKDLLAGEGASGLTQHGAFLGKLQYASIEQIMGLPHGQKIDFRTDIYSLGLTMFEVISGERAVEAEDLTDIVNSHTKGGFTLEIPPEQGGPSLRLVELIGRMCQPKRDSRPDSWEEVLAELWQCRAESNPLSKTQVKKQLEGGQPAEPASAAEPPSPARVLPIPAEAREQVRQAIIELSPDELKRELLIGRLVLIAGIFALLGSIVLAVVLVKSAQRKPVLDFDKPAKVTAPAR